MRVVFSTHARSELRAIALYIARDDKRRAQSFVQELRRKAEDLGRNPLAFPFAPHLEHFGLRRRVYRNYLIFFRVDKDAVRIIHIVHGARDHAAILSSDG